MLDKLKLPEFNENGFSNPKIAEHLPVVAHFDKDTMLTKNGELIQILEITGYGSAGFESSTKDFRKIIGQALQECIPGQDYAVYIHTIRSRKNLMPLGDMPSHFTDELNKRWCRKNNWDKQLVNTIYISIVKQGMAPSIFDLGNTLRSILYFSLKNKHLKTLQKNADELSVVADNISAKLSEVGIRKLTLLKSEQGYVSEQLIFYQQLIHLEQRCVYLPVNDLSDFLSSQRIRYDFNTLCINEDSGAKQYAAVFSIKEYQNLSHEVMDQLLQLGTQFVVTQAAIFIPASEAKKNYDQQYELAKLTREKVLYEPNGLEDFFAADSGKANDYCMQQITITVHSDEEKFFASKIKMVASALKKIGVTFVREDFSMAKLFWAQLPGNFRYLENARNHALDTRRLGGFAIIHKSDAGNNNGTRWGPPITLFRSNFGTPYFFNFHDQSGNGHTLFVGPKGSGKTVMSRFILAQACKVQPRIIYIDTEGTSKSFIEAINGTYHKLYEEQGQACVRLNPFDIKLFDGNVELYKEWLMDAIFARGINIAQYQEFFLELSKKLLEHRDVAVKRAMIGEVIEATGDNTINESYKSFIGGDAFNKLFTEGEHEIDFLFSSQVIGLDVSDLMKHSTKRNAFVGILLEIITNNLDGKPTIIACNNFEEFIKIRHFAPHIQGIYDKLTEKNAILLATMEHKDEFVNNKQLRETFAKMATKIFLSDKSADKAFRKFYDLDETEQHRIKSYDVERHVFLLKQCDASIVLNLDISDMIQQLNVLEEKNV